MVQKRRKLKQTFEKLVDLRKLSWPEIYRELQTGNSKGGKLAYLRQLSENHWAGRYRNGEKREVEVFLRGFLNRNGQVQANLALIFGCGYLDEAAKKKATREVLLTVYSFMSRSKVDGTTQGLLDEIRKRPPDQTFLKDVEVAVASSRL